MAILSSLRCEIVAFGSDDVKIPRDRESTFEPKIIPKRETLIEGTEDLILSLYTKGLSCTPNLLSYHIDY